MCTCFESAKTHATHSTGRMCWTSTLAHAGTLVAASCEDGPQVHSEKHTMKNSVNNCVDFWRVFVAACVGPNAHKKSTSKFTQFFTWVLAHPNVHRNPCWNSFQNPHQNPHRNSQRNPFQNSHRIEMIFGICKTRKRIASARGRKSAKKRGLRNAVDDEKSTKYSLSYEFDLTFGVSSMIVLEAHDNWRRGSGDLLEHRFWQMKNMIVDSIWGH